ncbi:hypothetical protein [uncultured Tenacibaculum sp.]|uniref:hypothetical protein n=1 Tax=uncultured Tenacibaculum sp. TaxID=174713 RepID=UPI00261868E3|nr:hypothetical protein [uncultured Tenacibaculum sp.]
MIFLVSLLLVSASSPFWHIKFSKGMKDGIFGFSSLRSFLYSFGTHFILFGASIFFFWILHLIPNINKKVKKIKLIGFLGIGLYCSVSIYYLLYVFIDTSNSPYPDYYYEIAFIFVSFLSSYIIFKVFNFLNYVNNVKYDREEKTKKIIDYSIEFINEASKKLTS